MRNLHRPLRAAIRPQRRVALAGLVLIAVAGSSVDSQEFGFVLEERWSFEAAPVAELVAAPDSSWLVAGSGSKLRLYPVGDNRERGPATEIHRLPKSLRSLAVSPGGETLAAVTADGTLHLYDLKSRRHFRTLSQKATAGAVAVAFNADGSYLLTGGKKGEIRAFTPDGNLFANLDHGHERRRLVLIAGVPPGRGLVSIGEDRRIVLWDPDVQRALRSSELDLEVLSAGFGGGRILALGLRRLIGDRSRSLDGRPPRLAALDVVRLIDVETGTELRNLPGDDQDIRALAVTPDDRFVAAGGSAGHASIWSVDDGRRLTRIPLDSELTALAFAPDGTWMAAGTEEGQISLFSLAGVGPRPTPTAPPPDSPTILISLLEPEALAQSRQGGSALIQGRSVRLRGRINSPKSLRSLEVGGREITSITPTKTGYLFTADVSLPQPGRHEIDIFVEDAAGNTGIKTVAIDRATDVAAELDPTGGRRLALIVGISRYQTPSINLDYASRDARAVYDLLTSPSLGPAALRPRDVRLLVDGDATVESINTGLRDFLQSATETDFVLFYFAGHGIPDPNRPRDLYLMAHDTDPTNIAGSGLLMRHVREAIAELRARDVLILTDACHSAGMAAPRNIRSITINPIHESFREGMRHASGGLAILTASEAAQVSLEGPKWQDHGVFTFYLLQGLRGAADLDGDRLITLGEIMEYVRERVKDATGAQQIPAIGPTSFDRQMPLVLVPEIP